MITGNPPTAATLAFERPAARPRSNTLLAFVLLLFLLSCIFDPADRVLGAKIPLFLLSWFVAALYSGAGEQFGRIHVGLLIYTLLFLLVPVSAIAWYWFIDGREPFEGFQLLKGYLLITLALLLYMSRINLLPSLCAVLTMLAMMIILAFIAVSIEPDVFGLLYVFGVHTGIATLDHRDYGSGLVLQQIYFVTSPMLAISISYYFDLVRSDKDGRRLRYAFLTLLSIAGMMLAGTRNNIVVSIALPLALLVLYSRNKLTATVLCLGIAAAVAVPLSREIAILLDPSEFSNFSKLALLDDYAKLFANPMELIFGQGLGAYHYWEAKGKYSFVTELTYLEVVRSFGLIGGVVMMSLLLFPLAFAFLRTRPYPERHIVVGYGFYLIMCASNPNFFSSMGMLILAIVLANMFLRESQRNIAVPRTV